MTPTPSRAAALTCLLLALAALVPATHAGSFAHMEITDDDDDAVPDGVTCPVVPVPFLGCPGWDFMACDVDLHGGYVTDTPDSVLLSISMRSDVAFTTEAVTGCLAASSVPAPTPGTGDFDYHFFVDSKGKTYDASAHLASDGTWSVGGVATVATVTPAPSGACPATACPSLTLTVPKAALGVQAGDVLTHLYATAHGEDSVDGDYSVADRAPSANYGLDYTILNGTGAAAPVYATLPGPRASVSQAFGVPHDGTYVFNWTSPAGSLSFLFNAQPVAGTLSLRIATASNQTLDAETFTAATAGNKTLTGASGPLTVTLRYVGYNGTFTMSLAEARASPGTTAGASPTLPGPSSTTAKKGTPALGLLGLAGAVGFALLVRRRL
ncbi:MAG: hypothetical protein QOG31_464 [Thermoplasmata archaeon]|jgi:hypothetical protein|nr:hypothetical protein [Thermoplasmata archaeon]